MLRTRDDLLGSQIPMKPWLRRSVLIMFLTCVPACTESTQQGDNQYASNLKRAATQVEQAVWAFHAADTAMDAEAVIDLLWPEYTMLVDGEWTSYDEIANGSRVFMNSLELFYTEWTNLRITPLGPDAAVSSFQFRDSIITNTGELIQNRGPTTFVWQRRNADWKLIHGDSDHYPIDQ